MSPDHQPKSESTLEKAGEWLEEKADAVDDLGNELMGNGMQGAEAGEAVKAGGVAVKELGVGVEKLPEALKVTENVGKITIEKIAAWAKGFLGEDARVITNKAGDKVFVDSENTRRIRFDINNSHGDVPHMHIEVRSGNRWTDYTRQHRIYFNGES